ncbi:MAG TPA: phenolic acid decarboxylase [Amycolatopsis sp.]|jgi:phenolic acid decarboxylase|nr:phenolic acid decarboxylase [Amycolatopsis sp.]
MALTTILGARLRWHHPNNWLFDPVVIGPDTIDYTVREGPHAGRHAVQPTHYHRIAPGIELTSWYEEVGTVVTIVWYLETQTTHRFAAIPAWAAQDIGRIAADNQDPEYLEKVARLAADGSDGPRLILADDGYFELLPQ